MRLEDVTAWCDRNGYTEPFKQEGRWWAFPPGGVMPVELPYLLAWRGRIFGEELILRHPPELELSEPESGVAQEPDSASQWATKSAAQIRADLQALAARLCRSPNMIIIDEAEHIAMLPNQDLDEDLERARRRVQAIMIGAPLVIPPPFDWGLLQGESSGGLGARPEEPGS